MGRIGESKMTQEELKSYVDCMLTALYNKRAEEGIFKEIIF